MAEESNLTFVTESLPAFFLRQPTTAEIEVSGGTPPYNFELTEGTLPKGLSLTKGGKILGTPRELADVTVSIKVKDREGASLTQAFQVLVIAP